MDVPTLIANASDLRCLVHFIYTNESILERYGALKIQLTNDCQLALKKTKPLYKPILQQKVTKMHDHEPFYSIETTKCDSSIQNPMLSSITTEDSFWSALSHPETNQWQSAPTTFPKKSFFHEKSNQKYFSMWHIPGQSLLQVLSTDIRKMFVPKAELALGPGTIFPLSSTSYGLSSLIYHHDGGARHWYIIPAFEQEALQKLIEENKIQNCNELSSLLIDPSMLDKYHIRYHRLIQYPNELVVLAAGTVTQSFVNNKCWSESCMFALPSWILNGNAFAQWPFSRHCQKVKPINEWINLRLFTETRIRKYIATSLCPLEQVGTISTPTDFRCSNSFVSDEILSSYLLTRNTEQSANHGENDREKTVANLDSSNNTPLSEFSMDYDALFDLLRESSDQAYSIESRPSSTNIDDQMIEHQKHCNKMPDTPLIANESAPLCEPSATNVPLENLSPSLPVQVLKEISRPSLIESEAIYSTMAHNTKQRKSKLYAKANRRRTLFVSGLHNGIRKADLYLQFPGSIKVTMKASRTDPRFQYAFVLHRTFQQAKRNFSLPINRDHFGLTCSVAFSRERCLSSVHQPSYRFWNDKTVLITRIPSVVSKDDLQEVFPLGHIIKYCPAYVYYSKRSDSHSALDEKTLTGYAFVSFNTDADVAHVISHSHEYRIHGQPLKISFNCHHQSPRFIGRTV